MSEILRTSIGKRLAAERQRLELTQLQLAEWGGVSRRSVISWEQGDLTPNAEFLAAAASKGLDVLFVVTGTHRWDQTASGAAELLGADEAALLRTYNGLPEKAKATIKDLMALLAGQG